jgi:hypothetical protein
MKKLLTLLEGGLSESSTSRQAPRRSEAQRLTFHTPLGELCLPVRDLRVADGLMTIVYAAGGQYFAPTASEGEMRVSQEDGEAWTVGLTGVKLVIRLDGEEYVIWSGPLIA